MTKEETRKCKICGETKLKDKFQTSDVCITCYHREWRRKQKVAQDVQMLIKKMSNDGFVVIPIEEYSKLLNNAKK